MRHYILAATFGLTIAFPSMAAFRAAADEGPAPRTGVEVWGQRLQKQMPKGWTLTAQGSEIAIERNEPVLFALAQINAPAASPETPPARADLQRGVYRLRLRFGDRVSVDEYQKLVAENTAAARHLEALQQKLGLPHKFDDFIATTAEEKERLQAYREAEAKIVVRDLPDLYSPEHGIRLFQSWSSLAYVADRKTADECKAVRESALKCFGMYETGAAANREDLGRPEPAARP